MKVRIEKSRAEGTVAIPPSKSDAHRKLICAAMCPGETTVIHGMYPSRDILATVSCLEALGALCTASGSDCTVTGTDFRMSKGAELECGESGSTLRFMIPLCMLSGEPFRLHGTKKLLSRPLSVYSSLAKENGVRFETEDEYALVSGKLTESSFTVPGDISSQFITGLMLRAAACGETTRITVTPPFESRSYALMTADVLRRFGVSANTDENIITVSGAPSSPGEINVEGDWSSAAFFEAFNFMGGKVQTAGLSDDSFQPDRRFREIAERRELCADLSDCPDLAPMLFALAAYRGYGKFCGTARLRYKESDRAEAMKSELCKMGAETLIEEDSVTVTCPSLHAPVSPISSHNDHRIAMAMSVLCTVTGGTVDGAEAVSKSMPDFFEKLKALGVNCSETNP